MNDQKRIEVHRLDAVPIRDVRRHEAYDFSRWLAENLDRLSEALGVELERIATEHPVGRYSLDILARLPGGEGPGELVVVENQLEQSDHDHLGKCLTYAAGVGASTVVWITPSLNPEHRAAMEWLDQNTHDGIRFFVVAPRAGASPTRRRLSFSTSWSGPTTGRRRSVSARAVWGDSVLERPRW